MAKISNETITRWKKMAEIYADRLGMKLTAVTDGGTAWVISHNTGIIRDAYRDPTVMDAHIKTALEEIFPNVKFTNRYEY